MNRDHALRDRHTDIVVTPPNEVEILLSELAGVRYKSFFDNADEPAVMSIFPMMNSMES